MNVNVRQLYEAAIGFVYRAMAVADSAPPAADVAARLLAAPWMLPPGWGYMAYKDGRARLPSIWFLYGGGLPPAAAYRETVAFVRKRRRIDAHVFPAAFSFKFFAAGVGELLSHMLQKGMEPSAAPETWWLVPIGGRCHACGRSGTVFAPVPLYPGRSGHAAFCESCLGEEITASVLAAQFPILGDSEQ